MQTRAVMAIVALPLIAACGGTVAQPKSQTGGSTVTPSATSAAGPGSAGSITVGKAFWWGGFKVALGQATIIKPITPTPPTYVSAPRKVTIEAIWNNLGPDNFTPSNEDLVLQSGGQSYLDHDSTTEKIPEVPGLASGSGMISFKVDDKFSFRDAVLIVGNARFNQASVPLGTSGKLVTLEPQKAGPSGTLTMPNAFSLALSGGELSYDSPRQHEEEKAGDVHLHLTFSLTSNTDNSCCFGSDNADLKLPDGTAVVATRASCCGIAPKGTTTADDFADFVFKGADGAYDFIVKGKYGPGGAAEQADLPFNITLGQSAASGATSPVPGSLSPTDNPQPTPSGH
ncbi:MAG: hypothetical protein ABR598_00965 [Candidatus Dormibacteria bacterium]